MWRYTLVVLCLLGIGSGVLPAEEAPDYKKLYEEQKAKNEELERRLAIVEETINGQKFLPREEITEVSRSFLQNTELSGYVSGSYVYNFNRPGSHENTGRGFDSRHNEFMINKAVIRLERPLEANAFEWMAGYKVSLIFGQDAGFTQAAGLDLGSNGDLFEAYLAVNIPIGNGLRVAAGKYGTCIGYESTFTEENPNWSAGNQWTFAAPFTHTGVSLTYAFSPEWEAVLMINNGWDNVTDPVHGLSYVGQLTYTPNDQATYSLIGYGGPETTASDWRRGVQFWVERRFTRTFRAATQLDYGIESGADANGRSAEWMGAGLWLICEPSEHYDFALRADWLKDGDGVRTSGAPAFAPFAPNTGQELYSLTFTANFRPVPELRLSPEIRWDRSSKNNAFDGHKDQVTLGVGAAFFY
jgi:hypothetical protein